MLLELLPLVSVLLRTHLDELHLQQVGALLVGGADQM